MEAYSTPWSTESEYSAVSRTRAELYQNGIYPEKVRDHAREVLGNVDPGLERYRYAAALTRYVYREVDQPPRRSNRELFRPDYILDHGVESDCEDVGVLLSSLLEVRSFNTRLLVGSQGGGGHLMVQVEFPFDKVGELQAEARSFYGEDLDLFYEKEGESAWLLCDTVRSPVAGCINSDYFNLKEPGELVLKDEIVFDRIEV